MEKIYNDYKNIVLFWNFYQLSRIDANLFKTEIVECVRKCMDGSSQSLQSLSSY